MNADSRYSAVYFQKSGCSTLSLVLSQCRGAAAVQRRQEALIYHQVCLCAEHLIFRTKRVWTWTSIISASRHDREEVKKKKIMRIQPESQWATFQVPVTTLTGSKRSRKGDVFTRDWNLSFDFWICCRRGTAPVADGALHCHWSWIPGHGEDVWRFKSWQTTQQGSSGSDCEAEAWGIYSLPRWLLNISSGEPYNFGRAGGEVEEEGTCKLLGTSSCGIEWGNARGNKLQENVPTPLPNDTTFQPM